MLRKISYMHCLGTRQNGSTGLIEHLDARHSRRGMLKSALVLGGVLAVQGCTRGTRVASLPLAPLPPAPDIAFAKPEFSPVYATPPGVRPEIFERAVAALDAHKDRILRRDRIAIADFALGSSHARFHLVDLDKLTARTLLVAHGSGSDPEHTGYLQTFSNEEGSNASSHGAFVAADYYEGKHGRSQRLIGLDSSNNRALERAIVIHGAWYSNPEMLVTHGKLGRSQGCFAVGEGDLDVVFAKLGEGRMIYSAKV
jgi:hypothetical protein